MAMVLLAHAQTNEWTKLGWNRCGNGTEMEPGSTSVGRHARVPLSLPITRRLTFTFGAVSPLYGHYPELGVRRRREGVVYLLLIQYRRLLLYSFRSTPLLNHLPLGVFIYSLDERYMPYALCHSVTQEPKVLDVLFSL